MVRDGDAVQAGLAGLVARFVAGEKLNVSLECDELGISREQFYKYVGRFRAEGVDGFFPRSRAPRRRPTAVSPAVEDVVVRARKQLDDDGLDIGATSIRWWLQDHPDVWREAGLEDVVVPSRATIHRVLVRRGLVTAAPRRRPRRSRRFVRPARNELWQMDGYDYVLADGTIAVVIEVVDDHSRVMLACHAAVSENADDVWTTFSAAAGRYGLPMQLLTDNGTAFSGSRRGWTSQLEAGCADLGVRAIASSVNHPQTCGKVERGHGTGRRWLARQATPATLAELQQLLDRYREIYNNRRHQSLDGLTPNQAWQIAPVSGPAGEPLTYPLHVTTARVSASGCLGAGAAQTEIGLGRAHAGKTATVFRCGDDLTIFVDGHLVRELTIDRTRRYQRQAR
jgi:transposase InsO family protein